jgi:hypothetical protein
VTTLTSSLPSATVAGLFDELVKIGEAVPPAPEQSRKDKVKKWAKNTAILATGAGAGMAASMAADRWFSNQLGQKWQNMDSKTKRFIVGPALGWLWSGSTQVDGREAEEGS